MSTMKRRSFVKNVVIGSAVLFGPRSLRATDSRIEILAGEPVAAVSPDLFGHFVEHLGGVVYDGVWVGENSKIPNYEGIRKELVDALRRLKPGVIRWPGGCFADSYNWHDGVGPRNQRPRRTNFWTDDPNLPERYCLDPKDTIQTCLAQTNLSVFAGRSARNLTWQPTSEV